MENTQHLLKFEQTLTEILTSKCVSMGFLDSAELLKVDELDAKWDEMAPEFMVDATAQFNEYPAATIAWAAYLGMGIAAMWDGAWDDYKESKDLYSSMRDFRGFDNMDEYIIEKLLGLNLESQDSVELQNLLLSCAQTTLTFIRNQQVEAQSVEAFYILERTLKFFFKLGVALELKQLGYCYKKIPVC